MHLFKRTTIIISAVVFSLIMWAAWQIIIQPDLGILWSRSGHVNYAKQDSPIRVDDMIVSIDHVPVQETIFPYYQWHKGDIIHLEMVRDDVPFSLDIPYNEQAPILILLLRLIIIIVALAFWMTSTIVALFLPIEIEQTLTYLLWCQAIGASLALGNVTAHVWSGELSNALTWLGISASVHFHFMFPLKKITVRSRQFIWASYVIAGAGIAYRLTRFANFSFPVYVASIYLLLFYIWVLIGIVMVLYLLVRSYRTAPSVTAQRQVGFVVTCGFLSVTPLLLLSVIPQILLGEPILTPQVMFIFLVGIPIGYGYAIRRYQFIKLERYISRSTTAVLVIGLLCLIYLGITALINHLLPPALHSPLIDVTSIMLLVIAYNPLRRRLQNFVDYLFYGGWYDYPSVVGEITHSLGKTTDIEALAQSLSHGIQKMMRVSWTCLLLSNKKEAGSVVIVSGEPDDPSIFNGLELKELNTIINYLQTHSRPTASREIQAELNQTTLSADEIRLLNYGSVRLWVPIHGRNKSTGFLLLGPKFGGDIFDLRDMEILDVVSKQASVVLQNAQLIAELEQEVLENERYQKQITRTFEKEREYIARELHDLIIQALVGFRYQIANMQTSLNLAQLDPQNDEQATRLQDEMGKLIWTARALCHDLRPPALDLGLIPSIRSIVSRFEMESEAEVALIVEGDRSLKVDEDISLCLFRCTSEALTNISKHAAAKRIVVELHMEPTCVTLVVEDDGRGFAVPERLGIFMEQNHFGIVGMRERLELVAGSFDLTSVPQKGTHLEASIPLNGGINS